MSIITISRGSYSKGKQIAEGLAKNLGYKSISRDILLETSQHFNIPEVKLVRALHDAPSILNRFTHGKEMYITYIREAFLEHIRHDNIVYHGLAGHFFIQGVPNILKVRILSNIENRVQEEMERENIDEKKARYLLLKDDEERRKWGLYLYGNDTKDSSLYDVVLHIDNLKTSDAIEILTDISRRSCFQTTPESLATINDLYTAAKAQSIIFGKIPSAEVKCKDSILFVTVETDISLEKEITEKVKNTLKDLEGIKEIKVHVVPFGM